MNVKQMEDALFDGLKGVQQAAEGLDQAAVKFAEISDADVNPQTSERKQQAISVAKLTLRYLKRAVDTMQGDWGCWAEDDYKKLSELCFEEMKKLRSPNSARAAYPSS